MSSGSPIPSIHLDASVVGEKHCYDAWREAVRAVYDVNPSSDRESTTESVKAWLLNDLIFSDVSFSSQAFSHDNRLSLDSNFLSLQLYRYGGSQGLLGENSWQIAPGDIHIFDFSREFYSTASDSSVIGVVIPHEYIGYDPTRHPPHMVFRGSTSMGTFLTNTLLALFDELPSVKTEDADDLSKGFCGLLEGLLKPQDPSGAKERKSREDRRNEMRSYLNRNLSDPNLGVGDLCQQFNMSRPSVYREFAETGGVANYIVQRRLERAYYQLASVPEGVRRIKEVAYGVGFNDPAHFSRLFRRRFGITPGQAASLNGAKRLTRLQQELPKSGRVNFGQLSEWLQSI
ncbi:AraC-like DNA-binding protein [Labrenzia sp. EL_13]|nr:AraC-like DNA-binding protein [Labrenzia sp. EL_195]MBG6202119.1 AraC-like DNA-binding protein [Labrenzia sp. EL_13]